MRQLISSSFAFCLLLFSSCGTENTPIYTLSTNVNPSEAGSISPASGEFDEGTELDISANANENWVFTEWQGDLSGKQNSTTIQMNEDKSVTALFEKRDYPLTVNTEGEGIVDESIVQSKTTDYPHGSIVKLTAEPDDGWEFREWQGDITGDEQEVTVQINDKKTVTAVFNPIDVSLTIETDGEGSIHINPEKQEYEYGDEVELTAIADDGWAFSSWEGDLSNSENPTTLIIDGQIELIATFKQSFLSSVSPLNHDNVEFHQVENAGSGRIYASTSEILIDDNEDGIWLSENDGGNWEKTYNIGAVFIIAASKDPDLVIAGLIDGGYIISKNGGKSWSAGNINDPFGNSIEFSNASATNKDNPIFLSSTHATRSGLFRSKNLGGSWQHIFTSDDAFHTFGSQIEQVEVVESDPKTVYTNTGFDFDIMKSTNGGNSFVSIKSGLPTNLGSIGTLVVNPDNADQLFINNNISENGGSSWVQRNINASNYFWLNNRLIQVTSNSLRSSQNLGEDWSTILTFEDELSGVSGTPSIQQSSDSLYLFYNGPIIYKISLDKIRDEL